LAAFGAAFAVVVRGFGFCGRAAFLIAFLAMCSSNFLIRGRERVGEHLKCAGEDQFSLLRVCWLLITDRVLRTDCKVLSEIPWPKSTPLCHELLKWLEKFFARSSVAGTGYGGEKLFSYQRIRTAIGPLDT
jgi:hypothetical protein